MIDINNTVTDIDEAMAVMVLSFSLVLKFLATIIYCQLTRRKFHIMPVHIIDGLIALVVSLFVYQYNRYGKEKNVGFSLISPPKREFMMFQTMIEDLESGIRFDWVMASIAFFYWLRVLLMFQLTSTFGPLITIVVKMVKELI